MLYKDDSSSRQSIKWRAIINQCIKQCVCAHRQVNYQACGNFESYEREEASTRVTISRVYHLRIYICIYFFFLNFILRNFARTCIDISCIHWNNVRNVQSHPSHWRKRKLEHLRSRVWHEFIVVSMHFSAVFSVVDHPGIRITLLSRHRRVHVHLRLREIPFRSHMAICHRNIWHQTK